MIPGGLYGVTRALAHCSQTRQPAGSGSQGSYKARATEYRKCTNEHVIAAQFDKSPDGVDSHLDRYLSVPGASVSGPQAAAVKGVVSTRDPGNRCTASHYARDSQIVGQDFWRSVVFQPFSLALAVL